MQKNMPSPAAPRVWATVGNFVEGGPVLGRRVANTTFLQALLSADPYDGYHFFLPDGASVAAVADWLHRFFPRLVEKKDVHVGDFFSLQRHLSTKQYHCMHLPDAISHFTQLVQMRNALAPKLFPVTGLTHSLSYARFMPEYAKHLWAGVSPQDAVIVTSESARLVMERVFQGICGGLGLKGAAANRPALEHIPLGVRTESLPDPSERWDAPERKEAATTGKRMRERLGLGAETVVLSLARFCAASKMDFMPLLSAMKRAQGLGLTPEDTVLVLAGWAEENDGLPQALQQYGASMGVRVLLFLRPTDEERRGLYAAADIFVSPSDNIQETFGLTVAEAGAACLPVVASDFDGYRDIIVHGRTGLLVPTLGFAGSLETDMQALFWYDNQYHLKLAQQTAVLVPELAEALARLGVDSGLRRRMGAAGRERIHSLFSWDAVINKYVALWDRLAGVFLSPEEEACIRDAAHPMRMKFSEYFRGHFTQVLDASVASRMTVRRTAAGEAVYKGALPLHQYAGMDMLLDQEAVRRLLFFARKPVVCGAVLENLQQLFHEKGAPAATVSERAAFTVLWALKHDYIEKLK